MPKPFFDPVKINLVEREEWEEDYDPAGRIQENAFNHSLEEIGTLQKDDLIDLADDVFNKGRKKPVSFTEEEEDAIWEAFQKNSPEIEAFNQMILDAITWDYEQAAMPDDGDLEAALDLAIEHLPYNGYYLGGHEVLEANLARLGYEESAAFIRDLLVGSARIYHQPGYYDRFLLYDPPSQNLLYKIERARGTPSSGAFEWAPETNLIHDKEFVYELHELIEILQEDLVIDFFKYLKKIMDDVDISNRMDFRNQWRNLLDEPSIVRGAKESIAEVIKKGRKK